MIRVVSGGVKFNGYGGMLTRLREKRVGVLF